jgi:predicted PurR-regulated permease PerM
MTDTKKSKTRNSSNGLLVGFASFIIIVAGLKASAPILMPLFVAGFLAIITNPIVNAMVRSGRSRPFSVGAVVIGVLMTLFALGWLVGDSAEQFAEVMPAHMDRIGEQLSGWLSSRNIDFQDTEFSSSLKAPLLTALTGTARGLATALSNVMLTVILLLFMLLEANTLPNKLRAAFSSDDARVGQIKAFKEDLAQYLVVKTTVSLLTGILLGLWVWLFGIEFPFLLGVIAFLFNFIPTFGSMIAAIPAILLAMVQFGLLTSGFIAIGYFTVNLAIGSLLETQIMGKKLGLSPVVVLLSVVFWGWVWGPTGMILAVPLTMAIRIYCDHTDDSRWVAIMLANGADQALEDQP